MQRPGLDRVEAIHLATIIAMKVRMPVMPRLHASPGSNAHAGLITHHAEAPGPIVTRHTVRQTLSHQPFEYAIQGHTVKIGGG